MNKKQLIGKYKNLEGVWDAEGAELARRIFLQDLEQLDEPQKPVVPQFVADWIEYCKRHNFTLFGCLDPENGFESLVNESFEGDVRKCIRWCRRESNIFARAWLDGYTVEKEKRYTVKVKGDLGQYLGKYYLNNEKLTPQFIRTQKHEGSVFTKAELEETGFDWVFDCEGMEVQEVE